MVCVFFLGLLAKIGSTFISNQKHMSEGIPSHVPTAGFY
jgi:hypothetical protein